MFIIRMLKECNLLFFSLQCTKNEEILNGKLHFLCSAWTRLNSGINTEKTKLIPQDFSAQTEYSIPLLLQKVFSYN